MTETKRIHRRRILSTLALMLVSSAVPGRLSAAEQTAQRYDSRSTVETALDYLLYLPASYSDEGASFPLLLFLHGAGERGSDLERVKTHGPPRMIAEGQELPAIVVSPQCPRDSFWTEEQDTLLGLLDDIVERYNVDPDRVYVTGLSMGGYGTWQLATAAPERFAAAAPICGGGLRIRARRLVDLPVWAFHGDRDTVVPLSETTQMVEEIRRSGGELVRLTVYPDTGHDSWTEAYDDPELWQWLFSQRRGREFVPQQRTSSQTSLREGSLLAREALASFITAWNTGDNEKLRRTMNFPFLTLGAGGTLRVAEQPEQFATDFAAMRERGWVRSAFDWSSLQILYASPDKVHCAVDFARYNEKGERYSGGRVLYVITRRDGHWGLQMRAPMSGELSEEAGEQVSESARGTVLDFFTQFNAANAEGTSALLNYPHAFLTADGRVAAAQTASDSSSQANFERMRASESWHVSTIDSLVPIPVSDSQVLMQLVFSRWRPDGSRYLTVPALWIVTKKDEHWGIQARSLMPPTFNERDNG